MRENGVKIGEAQNRDLWRRLTRNVDTELELTLVLKRGTLIQRYHWEIEALKNRLRLN